MYKPYIKTATQMMRPYIAGEDLTGISVSDEDVDEVMSVTGPWGMIVKGADNEARWYVSKRFFELNYERAKRQCEACRGRGVLIAIDDVSEKCTYCNGKGWIAL